MSEITKVILAFVLTLVVMLSLGPWFHALLTHILHAGDWYGRYVDWVFTKTGVFKR